MAACAMAVRVDPKANAKANAKTIVKTVAKISAKVVTMAAAIYAIFIVASNAWSSNASGSGDYFNGNFIHDMIAMLTTSAIVRFMPLIGACVMLILMELIKPASRNTHLILTGIVTIIDFVLISNIILTIFKSVYLLIALWCIVIALIAKMPTSYLIKIITPILKIPTSYLDFIIVSIKKMGRRINLSNFIVILIKSILLLSIMIMLMLLINS